MRKKPEVVLIDPVDSFVFTAVVGLVMSYVCWNAVDLVQKFRTRKPPSNTNVSFTMKLVKSPMYNGVCLENKSKCDVELMSAFIYVRMPKSGNVETFNLMNKEQEGARVALWKFYQDTDGTIIPREVFNACLLGSTDFVASTLKPDESVLLLLFSTVANKWGYRLESTFDRFIKNAQVVLQYRAPDNHLRTILLDADSQKICSLILF